MTADAKLVIVEFAAAERGDTAEAAKAAALMDLYMMSLFDGGRERTIAELTGLLCGAGFVVDHVTPLIGGAIMIEAAVGDKYGWH
jgi:hypothetical protein